MAYIKNGDIYVVADLAERNSKFYQFKPGRDVYVRDATADPNVSSGGAFYYYDAIGKTWIRRGKDETDFGEWATTVKTINGHIVELDEQPVNNILFNLELLNTDGYREDTPLSYDITLNEDSGKFELTFDTGDEDEDFRDGWTAKFSYPRTNTIMVSGEVKYSEIDEEVTLSDNAVSGKAIIKYVAKLLSDASALPINFVSELPELTLAELGKTYRVFDEDNNTTTYICVPTELPATEDNITWEEQ